MLASRHSFTPEHAGYLGSHMISHATTRLSLRQQLYASDVCAESATQQCVLIPGLEAVLDKSLKFMARMLEAPQDPLPKVVLPSLSLSTVPSNSDAVLLSLHSMSGVLSMAVLRQSVCPC